MRNGDLEVIAAESSYFDARREELRLREARTFGERSRMAADGMRRRARWDLSRTDQGDALPLLDDDLATFAATRAGYAVLFAGVAGLA